MNMREKILAILVDEIVKTKKRVDQVRYNSKSNVAKNPHDIRVKYLNSLARLIDSYQKLYKDIQLEQVVERISALENENENVVVIEKKEI
jgi:SHS2 domain-containing protein